MSQLHRNLEEWCKASGAKFNQEKTDIIPIGTSAHRQRMIESCMLSKADPHPINNNKRIAKDGNAIRILELWLGNDTNAATPWEPIIDKIDVALKYYSKLHPTLKGKKMISQVVIGGFMQFLTKA